MQACHILLGRPWKFDRRVKHDGFTNRHTFEFNGQTLTLKPMTPLQIAEFYEKKKELSVEQNEVKKRGDSSRSKTEPTAKISTTLLATPCGVLLASKEEYILDYNPLDAILVSLCKSFVTLSDEAKATLPKPILAILDEFSDVFPDEIPAGLPPFRGIEHKIDLIPGATLPNRPTYR